MLAPAGLGSGSPGRMLGVPEGWPWWPISRDSGPSLGICTGAGAGGLPWGAEREFLGGMKLGARMLGVLSMGIM